MVNLRRLLSVLAMTLLLPWGAFAGGHSSVARAAALEAATGVARTAGLVASAEVSAKTKCRFGGLLGSSCGPDMAALSDAPAAAPAPGLAALWPAAVRRGTGALIEPPRGPPRRA